MHHGALAELATGEGKTLVRRAARSPQRAGRARASTSPRSTTTWPGATPSGWRPIYSCLGLTVGVLQQKMADAGPHRRPTSATSPTAPPREFGFDFLRDRLKVAGGQGPGRAVLGAVDRAAASSTSRCDPKVQREPPLRPGGRGRQHLHRRGPHAAHHRHADAAGHARRSRSSTTGPTSSPADGARRALHARREEAEDRADRRRPAAGPLLQPADRPALARHGQAARARRAGAARPLPLPPRPALHDREGQDRHHRRVHRPAACPTATGARACTRRSRPRRGVPITMAVRPRRPDHLPELLPAVQEAGRHDRHGGAELAGSCAGSTSSGWCACRRTGR